MRLSVPGMEEKLAELLLLSNTPGSDPSRIMAAAGRVDCALRGDYTQCLLLFLFCLWSCPLQSCSSSFCRRLQRA